MVIVAISLLALCAVGGLAIDGGAAYSNRRQAQNASDSASLAGTNVLDDIRTGKTTDESKIIAAVTTKLTENQANPASITCEIVQYTGSGYGSPYPCPTTDLPTGTFNISDAAGVRVRANRTHKTSLMRVAGFDTITSTATATATIQAARGLDKGAAPFMICGDDNTAGHDGFSIPVLTVVGGTYDINEAAKYQGTAYTGPQDAADVGQVGKLQGGPWYLIHDDNGSGADNGAGTGVPGCGMGGQGFKGLVNTALSYSVPGDWNVQTGQVEGPTEAVLRSPEGCIVTLDGCYLAVPVGAYGQGNGSNGQLYVVKIVMGFLVEVGGGNGTHYVAFMTPGTTNPITGHTVPDFVLAGGVGGGQVRDTTQPYFIKLSE
jgi:Flp pilus assembly protein TadG